MNTILEADETGTLHLPPSLLPHPGPGRRYRVAAEGGQVVVDEAAAPQPDAASREAWLKELESRRARGATGKAGTPLQEILDDMRGEHCWMSHWDTSALVKLSVAEADSAQFQQLAGTTTRLVTAAIAWLEARTVFRRREAEGALPPGEAAALSADMDRDVADGRLVIQAADADVERAFANVLEKCFSQTPPVFIRTNDALHIASAIMAGETEFVTTDIRQRAAAKLMGMIVLP